MRNMDSSLFDPGFNSGMGAKQSGKGWEFYEFKEDAKSFLENRFRQGGFIIIGCLEGLGPTIKDFRLGFVRFNFGSDCCQISFL